MANKQPQFLNTQNAKHSTSKCKLLPQELRIHCVSVRLNNAELDKLNTLREHYSKGEWLRMASLQKLPPVIPAINTKAWIALTDISQKLNRIAAHIDGKSKDSHLTHTELLKWFTEFGHLNRGDMLTSEQHRCHNEKKKFQRRV